MGVEEERQALRERVEVQSPLLPELNVAEAVGQRERQLLLGGGSGLADVVAGDADGMELRDLLRAELDQVADQPEVRPGREDPFLLGDVLLQDVGLERPVQVAPRHPLPLRRRQEEGEEDGGGATDRHGRGDLIQGDPLEQGLEVGQ